MGNLPFGKAVSLRYVPNPYGQGDKPLGYGGMYATAPDSRDKPIKLAPLGPDADNQGWVLIDSNNGDYVIWSYIPWQVGVPPVGMESGWRNDAPEPGNIITLAESTKESSYSIDQVRKHEDGWIITIVPTGPEVVPDSYIGSFNNHTVEIVLASFVEGAPMPPGWYMEVLPEKEDA